MYNTSVTRLEVIDNNGRVYTNMSVDKIELSYQDGGKTLKLFTNGSGEVIKHEPVAYMNELGYAEKEEGLVPNFGRVIPLYTYPHTYRK